MQSATDLFSGFGGWTTGGKAAGLDVLWASNHWPEAMEWHRAKYPETQHVCQDLHQADWSQVPGHDLMLASPCCQGHTKARGLASANPKRDASRSTAWAPVGNAEVNRPDSDVLEKSRNSWVGLFTRLGYQPIADKWSSIVKPGRASSTLVWVENGCKRFGDRFVMPYYGSGSDLTGCWVVPAWASSAPRTAPSDQIRGVPWTNL